MFGTNPATPIYPSEMDLDIYVRLLLDYKAFMNYYSEQRLKKGKESISRTRIGMKSFFHWLSSHTESSVVETEIIPYPTAKLKELKKEPSYVIEKGKEIFFELLMELKPALLILHGKTTVEHTVDILEQKKILRPGAINLEEKIKEMETRAPLLSITYPNGEVGKVLACRHFMYYGSKGDSYLGFRNNLLKVLKELNISN